MTAALLALTAMLVLPTATASAAPLPATYSASAGGDVANVGVDLLTIALAGVRVANSDATVDSTTLPRSTATASNLAAAVVGVPLVPTLNSQTAPPDNAAPTVGPLPGLSVPAIGLDLGLLQSSTHARWAGDTACVSSDSVLAETTVSTTGLNVAPLGLAEILELGVASTTGTTRLAPTGQPGDNRAVTAEATGSLNGLSLINDAIGITIADEPVVAASATGVAGGATTSYIAPEVTVTLAGTEYPLVPGASVDLTIPLVASVTVSMPQPTTSTTPDGRNATTDLTFLRVEVELLALLPILPPVATATIDLLPLHAEAHAPTGGVSCPLAAPAITAPTPGQVTGANPTISGTGTPGATVTVVLDGTTAGTPTVTGGGTWSLPVGPLAEGAHSVVATQQAGESTSGPSNTVGFTVDATAPAAPVILTPANGSVTNDTTPTVSGTAEPGSTVAVSIDGTPIGTTVTNPDGTWTIDTTTPLGEGPHTVTATATDPAGNTSPPGTSSFTIDLTAPAAPTITAPANGSIISDTTPTVTGTAEALSTVAVSMDGTAIGTTATNGVGIWSLDTATALSNGWHTATATATDAAGNVSPSAASTFIVDSTAPAAPVILTPANGSITADTTPTVTGTAEPATNLGVSIDGTFIGATIPDSAGNWTVDTTTPLSTGTHTVTATATDGAGNVSAPGSSTFAVGTVPSAPIDVSAIGGDANARVKWHAPLDDGGAPLLTYEVETTPGGAITTVPASELAVTVTSLVNDSDYTFRVRVDNQLGWSPWSAASNVARPRGACPGSPFVDVGPDHAFCPEIKWMGDEDISRGYEDHTYRPVAPITRQAMAAFTYRLKNPGQTLPACTTQPFPDVAIDNAFCAEITWMRDTNITTGYDDGTFRPNAPVARQAMAAFLYRLDGSPLGGDPQCTTDAFTDVGPDHMFCGEVRWLVSTGVAEGYPDGSFGASSPITRQAMAAFIFRYNIYAGLIT